MLTWCGPQSKAKFQANKASKSKRTTGVRFAEVNLDEDESAGQGDEDDDDDEEEEEEREEDGDSDEFIDVLDVLDGRGEPDLLEEEGKGNARSDVDGMEREMGDMKDDADEVENMDEDEGSEESEEVEEDEDLNEDKNMDLSPDEADDDSPAALDSLGKFISSLDTGTKRKAEDGGLEAPRRKRRVVQERTEAGAENEFSAHVAGIYLSSFFTYKI